MAVCDVQTLLDTNPCLASLNARTLKLYQVQMLCQIKQKLDDGTEPSCDIATVLADTSCYASLTDFELDVLMAQLLCDIASLL